MTLEHVMAFTLTTDHPPPGTGLGGVEERL
jgi:hypothetical protein